MSGGVRYVWGCEVCLGVCGVSGGVRCVWGGVVCLEVCSMSGGVRCVWGCVVCLEVCGVCGGHLSAVCYELCCMAVLGCVFTVFQCAQLCRVSCCSAVLCLLRLLCCFAWPLPCRQRRYGRSYLLLFRSQLCQVNGDALKTSGIRGRRRSSLYIMPTRVGADCATNKKDIVLTL